MDSAVAEPPGLGFTFDCADAGAQARFWGQALGYEPAPPPSGWDSWEAWLTEHEVPRTEWNELAAIQDPAGRGPSFSFVTVPERKTAKNRLHPDLKVSGGRQVDQAVRRERIERKVAEVVAAGATVQARLLVGEHLDHVMLTDPEGNEFCVV